MNDRGGPAPERRPEGRLDSIRTLLDCIAGDAAELDAERGRFRACYEDMLHQVTALKREVKALELVVARLEETNLKLAVRADGYPHLLRKYEFALDDIKALTEERDQLQYRLDHPCRPS